MAALTFDDGPDPGWTPRVLAALAAGGARAIFFVDAGRALAHPETIAATLAGGHEIGFHCTDHIRHSEREEDEIAEDARSGVEALELLGVRPSRWRTPWGEVTETTRRVAADLGLEICGWSFDSHDWRGDSCEQMLAALAAEGALDSDGMVLMHDGLGPGARRQGCEETVKLTERLLAPAREDSELAR